MSATLNTDSGVYVVTSATTSKALWAMLNSRLNHDRIRHALKVEDHNKAGHDYFTKGDCETCVPLLNEARALIRVETQVCRQLRRRGI
jgi:hypothetical protein